MNTMSQESISGLIRTLEACSPEERFSKIPKLRYMIAMREASGDMPPRGARQMLRSLEEEAVEAIFDNMPV